MFNTLKRMIASGKYTTEYIDERIEIFYLVNKLTKEEYLELKALLNSSGDVRVNPDPVMEIPRY